MLEPIFERDFAEQSYGFGPSEAACKRWSGWKLLRNGYTWIVDVDLKSYFDTIPTKRLIAEIQKRIADGKVLKLLESYLKAGVMETGKGWQPTEQGTPQGAVISPLLANMYLNPLDHKMAREGYEMVRYADDLWCVAAPKPKPKGSGRNCGVDEGSWIETASDQDADSLGCGKGWIRLPGVSFRTLPDW